MHFAALAWYYLKRKGEICVTPTVLLVNLAPEKERQVKALCLLLKLRARTAAPQDFGQPIGALLGLAPRVDPPAAGEAFGEEILLMAGLSSWQMDQLLQGFRRKKIPPVELKAVLTPTNGAWDLFRLRGELALERQAVLQGERAHQEGTL